MRDFGFGCCEGVKNGGGLGKKTVVEVNEAQEMLRVLDVGGLGISQDGIHVGLEGNDVR